MAEGHRRSTRNIKVKESEDYEYGEECLSEILRNSGKSSSIWQPRNSSDEVTSEQEENLSEAIKKCTWSVLNYLPTYVDPLNLAQEHPEYPISDSESQAGNRSQSENQNELPIENVNKSSPAVAAVGGVSVPGRRLFSSTNYNFVDLVGNYLSADSSSVFTEMPSTDSEGERTGISLNNGVRVEGGEASRGAEKGDGDVGAAVFLLLEEMKQIRKKVDSLGKSMNSQNNRLESIEQFLESGNESVSEAGSIRGKGGKSKSSSRKSDFMQQAQMLLGKNDVSKKSKEKSDKERALRVSIDALKSRQETEDSNSEEESSEDDFAIGEMKKKMTKKQKKESKQKLAARVKQVGVSFPDDESSNHSSGTDSDTGKRRSRKKKVKSGEKVKKRPVVRTELWPHTVANEEDGEEVSSETISLAKFLSCFTYIMASCEDAIEAAGRMWLLHALASVLEFWPWTETRSFHNMVMVRLEQGRIGWDCDFTELANQFMEKKVRQGMRSRVSQAGGPNQKRFYRGYRRGFNGSQGGGSGSNGGSGSSGSYRSQYNSACRQWNNGTCTFGMRCKMSHCCSTCAENGRYGDHKAINHGSDSGRGRTEGQRS